MNPVFELIAPTMRPLLVATILGVMLSIPWGIGDWLGWQQLKQEQGTILPYGSLSGYKGGIWSLYIRIPIIIIVIYMATSLGWWLLITMFLILFCGGWIATLIERKVYDTEYILKLIIYSAKDYKQLRGIDFAKGILPGVAPIWWIKLMPKQWRCRLQKQLDEVFESTRK